ncbi:MAG TPA: CopD family protein [Actinomycetota bacterium]|nr:CopD family protein [Actinomycetota bacterium]
MEDALRSVALPLVRFAAFGANALLFGLLPVLLLVVRPGLAGLGTRPPGGRRRLAARLEGFVQAALWGSAAATVLALTLQAVLVSQFASDGDLSQESLLSVFETSFGQWYGLRLPLLLGLAVLLSGRVRSASLAGAGDGRRGPGAGWWAAWGGLGVLLLATSSFSGHAAVANPRLLSLVNDVVHLVAGATWFAGIVVLSVALPEVWRAGSPEDRLDVMRATIVRFSNLALVSIGVVLVTGVVNSFLHIGAPDDLIATSYGRALGAKLVLFALILVLGAVNHLVVRRRLERGPADGRDAPRIFRRTIAAELVVALAIMAVTGLLTGLARTREDSPPPPPDDAVTSGPPRT